MFKSVSITVPPGTAESDPVREAVPLSKGTLTKVVVRPPPGPNWEVYIKVKYREFSLLPLNEDEWIPLEKDAIQVDPNFTDWDGTYDIIVELCSPQARFSHDIVVEFHLEEKESVRDMVEAFISGGFKWLKL